MSFFDSIGTRLRHAVEGGAEGASDEQRETGSSSNTRFTSAGVIPAVEHGFHDLMSSASDRAFGHAARGDNYVELPKSNDNDINTAREAVIAAEKAAWRAIDRTKSWVIDQWAHYYEYTAESPSVVWEPDLLPRLLGFAVGTAMDKATGAVGSAAATLGTIPGFLAQKGIGYLGKSLKGVVVESIEGGKELSPEAASAEGSASTGEAIRAKLPEIDAASAAAKGALDPSYRAKRDSLISHDQYANDVDGLKAWAQADHAQSDAINPQGNALFTSMLAHWVAKSAFDPDHAKMGINNVKWKAACKLLFGFEHVPHGAYWAMELRSQWHRLGLPTAKADAWLASAAQRDGEEVWFDSAEDRTALAKSLVRTESSPAYLHIAQGGDFKLSCRFATAPRPDGEGFHLGLDWTSYTLETVGMVGGDQTVVRSGRDLPAE